MSIFKDGLYNLHNDFYFSMKNFKNIELNKGFNSKFIFIFLKN